MKHCLAIFSVILSTWACLADGHGYLLKPPSRSSAWRLIGDPNFKLVNQNRDKIVENPSDSGNNCGGVQHQFKSQGGKCGICGDAADLNIKPHEFGGKYYTGEVLMYYQQGETIELQVKLTAAHKGFFQFYLCPLSGSMQDATHECLKQHLLTFGEGTKTKYEYLEDWTTGENGLHKPRVKLPDDVACEHCVLQWRYHAGNNWGCDENNNCALGLGIQEEFYGCADIGINATEAPTGAEEQEGGWIEDVEEEVDPEDPCAWRPFSTAAPTIAPYSGKPKPPPLCVPELFGKHLFRTCTSFYECHGIDEVAIYYCGRDKLFDETTGRCGTTSSEPFCLTL